ncbi:MAG: hypothetical protein QM756_23005 [Polyangiaceae bacterium]
MAIAALGELATVANELGDLSHKRRKDAAFGAAAAVLARQVHAAILRVAGLVGLLRADAADYRLRTRARRLALRSLDEASVDARVKARNDARAAKNFEESDRIRAELTTLGISLRDGTDSTEWTVEQ